MIIDAHVHIGRFVKRFDGGEGLEHVPGSGEEALLFSAERAGGEVRPDLGFLSRGEGVFLVGGKESFGLVAGHGFFTSSPEIGDCFVAKIAPRNGSANGYTFAVLHVFPY